MSLVQIIPIVGIITVFALILAVTFTDLAKAKGFWLFWLVYAIAYGLFSIWAISEDGLMMFWTNHSTNLVGNQVWIDLIVAVLIGWMLILPEARSRNMNVTFWMVFIMATATIGFGAMIGRVLYLRSQDETSI